MDPGERVKIGENIIFPMTPPGTFQTFQTFHPPPIKGPFFRGFFTPAITRLLADEGALVCRRSSTGTQDEKSALR